MNGKLKLVIIAAVLLMLLSGCNLKKKIGESITEGVIEKASDGEVDVDINGDDITYSTDEGEAIPQISWRVQRRTLSFIQALPETESL
ncbi:MAG TPA: hypothetical protein VN258_19485 [Mobilitalea sp.]|nr:hypothetical protein [Mobilitalea sp.]